MVTPPPLATRTRATAWQPPSIRNLQDTGLSHGFLADLSLKYMYVRGQVSGFQIAEDLRVPFSMVLSPILDFLKRERMCEITGSGGLGAGAYQYVITSKGTTRAREQLERNTYIGAAPVPWELYVQSIRQQGRGRLRVNELMMRRSLSHLILDDRVFNKIGPAVNSGRSIFLYGPPGNGKTTIAESIGRLVLGEDMYVPYAVEVDGQIIKVYDEINHVLIQTEEGQTTLSGAKPDQRWVKINRPVITVGGELNLEGLELAHDPISKYYEAPFQMKANGGMFLIDDFGRQLIRPRDLLNRWIVPMEKGVDYLSLTTGRKIEVPFEVLLVFSTNLPPRDLVDEAFLRRIRHKIEISSPSFDSFREIFKRICNSRNIAFDEQAVRYLLQEYYIKKSRKLRANHPRDLVDQLVDIASYTGVEPQLTKDLLDAAADSYFVDL